MVLIRSIAAVAVLLARALAQEQGPTFTQNTNPATADQTRTWALITNVPSAVIQDDTGGEFTYTYTADNAQVTVFPAFDYISADRSYTIDLNINDSGLAINAACWYPVSGNYSNLQRYLFYITLLFALFARKHEWLIMGALASSLTYSGAAAIHAMIMTWSRQNQANNDMYAVLGILALSAAFVLPLLNWSSTIRNMGKEKEENSVGRTIIIYWGFMIFLGFISQFVGIVRTFTNNTSSKAFVISAFSSSQNMTCTPSSGVLDLTAGQQQGFELLYITPDFIDANSCTNPCSGLVDGWGNPLYTITRKTSDLVPLTAGQINHFLGYNLSQKQLDHLNWYLDGFMITGTAVLVFIILQGIAVLFFGRRTPREVRNTAYVRLTKLFSKRSDPERVPTFTSMDSHARVEQDLKFSLSQHKTAERFAKIIAFLLYLWAWSSAVLSGLLAVVSVVATEYWMYEVPQSDQDIEIGQWGSWAGTALVLLVAIAYKFHGMLEDSIVRGFNRLLGVLYVCFHGKRARPQPAKQKQIRAESNRQMLWLMFTDVAVRRTSNLFYMLVEGAQKEWSDLRTFLGKDSWNTAIHGQGQGHLRRRRAIAGDQIKVPEKWVELYDEWLDVDEFIEAVKHFDAEYRTLHGHGYKWQPRVTEEMPLRAEFDAQLLHDLFHHRKGPAVSAQSYAIVSGNHPGDISVAPFDPERAFRPRPAANHIKLEDRPAYRKQSTSSDSEDEIELRKLTSALPHPGSAYEPISNQTTPMAEVAEPNVPYGPDSAWTPLGGDSKGSGGGGGGGSWTNAPMSRYSTRRERYNGALSTTSPPTFNNNKVLETSPTSPPSGGRPHRVPSRALAYGSSNYPPQYMDAGAGVIASPPRTVFSPPDRAPSYDTSQRTYGKEAGGMPQRAPSYDKSQRPQPGRTRSGSDMDKSLPPPPPSETRDIMTPIHSAGPSGLSSRAEPESYFVERSEHDYLVQDNGQRHAATGASSISELDNDARSVRRQ